MPSGAADGSSPRCCASRPAAPSWPEPRESLSNGTRDTSPGIRSGLTASSGRVGMALSDVAVVGVYATEQARQLPHRTSLDLAQEAVLGAIADAGLRPQDVDGVAADWPGPGGRPGE